MQRYWLQPQRWKLKCGSIAAFARLTVDANDRIIGASQIGWIEWHCGDLMPQFGYEPRVKKRLRHWMKPIRGEGMHEFFKSRAYSLCDGFRR